MNHLPLIELSIIPSQEFSSSKVELREESWWIGIDSEQMAKKNISSAENHREMLQRQQKGNQQQCLNDSKKKSLFNFTFFFKACSGFFRSINYGHFVTFLHIIQHDFFSLCCGES